MKHFLTLSGVLWLLPVVAFSSTATQGVDPKYKTETQNVCAKIGRKLSSVSVHECNGLSFDVPRFYSVGGLPILEKYLINNFADRYFPASSCRHIFGVQLQSLLGVRPLSCQSA